MALETLSGVFMKEAQGVGGEAVSEERQRVLDRLLDSCASCFDIEQDAVIDGERLAAIAEFHSRSERYVLVKSAKLWAAESNEYLFFVSEGHVDLSRWRSLRDLIRTEGLNRIKPHSEHMCSYVSMVLLADNIDEHALREIRRYRFSRSFRLSLHGWMEFKIAALDCASGSAVSNPQGKALLTMLKKATD